MLEFNWDDEAERVIVEKTELAKNPTYISVYNTWIYFTFQFLIPTLCLAIFSGLLVQELRKMNAEAKTVLQDFKSKAQATERRLTYQCITIVLVFVICNSFYMIYYILRSQGLLTKDQHQLENQYIHSTARIFAIINSSVNVIIYVVFNRKFRETFVSILTQFSLKSGAEPTSRNDNQNSREGLKLLKIENTPSMTATTMITTQ